MAKISALPGVADSRHFCLRADSKCSFYYIFL